ncbi:MAG: nucleotide exchange factor GrpE [Sporolactobacillus sp.]
MTDQVNNEANDVRQETEAAKTVENEQPATAKIVDDAKNTTETAGDAETTPESNEALLLELKRLNSEQEQQIGQLRKQTDELKNRVLRVQADFDNFRKRTVRERADARKFRSQELVSDLLDTVDNFQRALAIETVSEDSAALKKGLEMVLDKLTAALKKEGVESIDSLGKPFDPTVHQAVAQEPSDAYAAGTVMEVLQPGYVLNGRVLRPAMVKVSA